jgi:transglutaminase-like putative cysteine protease
MTIRPRTFDIDCRLSYELDSEAHFVFQLHALPGRGQTLLSESLHLPPGVTGQLHEDPQQGHRLLRLDAPRGPFAVRYRARVEVRRRRRDAVADEVPVSALPDDVLHHVLPTRYCESDLLASATLKLFGDLPPGIGRVQAICDWVHRNVDYRIGSSDSTTTACDVFLRRAGVCRDFAHLAVTFCRALNIPARLAVGYTAFDTPPPDFHAMLEAFVGGRWQLFDPTRMADPRDLVLIASGRDATDVAFATIFGAARSKTVLPRIRRVD